MIYSLSFVKILRFFLLVISLFAFLHLSDSEILKIFEIEIRPIVEANLGNVRDFRIGSGLGGDALGYLEFIAERENNHVAPRVFVYEHPKYVAQKVLMKSYEEEKKSWYK